MKRQHILWIRLLVWVLIIFVLCSMPVPKVDTPKNIPHLDKVAHFVLFFFFGAFVFGFLQERKAFNKIMNAVLVMLATASYGGIIEWLQGDYFARSADIWDWWADMLGALVGIFSYSLLHIFRQRLEKCLRNLFFKNSR